MGVLRNGTSGDDWFENFAGGSLPPNGILVGFQPTDTLVGGAGNDSYHLNFGSFYFSPLPVPPVLIVELPGGGWDSITFGYIPGVEGFGPFPNIPRSFQMPYGIEAGGISATNSPQYYTIHGNGLDNLINVKGVPEQVYQNFAYGGAGNDLLQGEFDAVSLNG